jgi:hypothetical protein
MLRELKKLESITTGTIIDWDVEYEELLLIANRQSFAAISH